MSFEVPQVPPPDPELVPYVESKIGLVVAQARVIITSVVTIVAAAATALTGIAASGVLNQYAPEAAQWAAAGALILTAAVRGLRTVAPVAPEERGVLPKAIDVASTEA